jgi:cytochrome c556
MRSSLLVVALVLASCVAQKNTPIAEIPKLASLEDVMDNQATAIDPQFKKIDQATFDAAELAAIAQAAERVSATSLKTKDFAKGRAEFEGFATKLHDKAKALGDAATAKDAKAISATLTEMRQLCRDCHGKFR